MKNNTKTFLTFVLFTALLLALIGASIFLISMSATRPAGVVTAILFVYAEISLAKYSIAKYKEDKLHRTEKHGNETLLKRGE